MTVAPVIKKIPGKPVKFQHEKDGFVNLCTMDKLELVDLMEREKKLLSNKKFIDKLPDKGKKIENFYRKIQDELKKRHEQDKLCSLISNLSVNDSKSALNELEWTGNFDSSKDYVKKKDTTKNLIKNETDPLQMLATHSGTNVSNKKLLAVEDSETLVQPPELSTNPAAELEIDLYARQLCRLVDTKGEKIGNKFYPYKSLNKTFVRTIPSSKVPEISAAYVPKNISGQTKFLSLEESIVVHQEQLKHFKEVETKHAVERLMKQFTVRTKLPKNCITSYREQDSESSDDEDSYVTEDNSEEEYGEEEKVSNLSDVD